MCYSGQVKCIYIDPPYNTGKKDFVYNDRFIGANDLWRHSTWVEFMYQRLTLAKELLRQDGVIFVSIDDNEVAPLRLLMDKIFGQNNFVAQLIWAAGRKNDSRFVSVSHEYIICFCNDIAFLREKNTKWQQKKKGLNEIYAKHKRLSKIYGNNYVTITQKLKEWFKSLPKNNPAKAHKHYSCVDKRGIFFPDNISWPGGGGPVYEVLHPITKKPVSVPSRGWVTPDQEKMNQWIADDLVLFGEDETAVPCKKSYLADHEYQTLYSVFYQDGRAASKRLRNILGSNVFAYPKDENILMELIEATTDKNDIILDFFAGSGTTGHAVLKMNQADGGNRKFILVSNTEATPDNPDKNLCRDVCAERIRRVINGYHDVEGLGGNFAYLRCRRVAPAELLDIDHAEVWHSLSLMHLGSLTPYRPKHGFMWAGDDVSAVAYVPRYSDELLPALRAAVQTTGEATIYSWQPEMLKSRVRSPRASHQGIPDTLARRFGLGRG
jgi:adenine-specific DNA-methyltransferase